MTNMMNRPKADIMKPVIEETCKVSRKATIIAITTHIRIIALIITAPMPVKKMKRM